MRTSPTPSRRRSKRPVAAAFVLDGTPAGSPDETTAIAAELRQLGVRVPRLLDQLEAMPARVLLIQEARAAALVQHLRPAKTFIAAIGRAFQTYERQLSENGGTPERVALAYAELVQVLTLPANASSDTPVAGYASTRRALDARQRRIKPGAPVGAIRSRFMPEVRAVVFGAVLDALARLEGDRWIDGRCYDFDDTRHRERAASLLTARFVRAFYPTWGAGTTPEHVRKSNRKLPRSRRAK